jgi:hypothetical protein
MRVLQRRKRKQKISSGHKDEHTDVSDSSPPKGADRSLPCLCAASANLSGNAAVPCSSKNPAGHNAFLTDAGSCSTATAVHCKQITAALAIAPATAVVPVAPSLHSLAESSLERKARRSPPNRDPCCQRSGVCRLPQACMKQARKPKKRKRRNKNRRKHKSASGSCDLNGALTRSGGLLRTLRMATSRAHLPWDVVCPTMLHAAKIMPVDGLQLP